MLAVDPSAAPSRRSPEDLPAAHAPPRPPPLKKFSSGGTPCAIGMVTLREPYDLWEDVMGTETHYQINICGGDFQHVKHRFAEWKEEPLIYRKDQRMFEGKTEVRLLSDHVFDNAERART